MESRQRLVTGGAKSRHLYPYAVCAGTPTGQRGQAKQVLTNVLSCWLSPRGELDLDGSNNFACVPRHIGAEVDNCFAEDPEA